VRRPARDDPTSDEEALGVLIAASCVLCVYSVRVQRCEGVDVGFGSVYEFG
jgi:hypothetical protein